MFKRQVAAGARTVFEKKAFTMLYFRENVDHLQTLYSPKTLDYVVTAQDEGVCNLMGDIMDEASKEHCLTLGGKQDHGFFPLLKNMGIDLKYNIEISELD